MEHSTVSIKDNSANPGPLGLLAFGMTTVLLNLHNAGFYEMNSMILAMGIFYGGSAQIVAGILESKKNNSFGMTAFISYGFFWLTLVGLILMPELDIFEGTSTPGMIAYFIMWGIFTSLFFIGTLRINKALQFVFGSLAILFFLLALGRYTGNHLIETITGYEGIICGASAIYAGVGTLLNEVYGKIIMPLGPVTK
ncbi:GPR1/FUN34/yaaH family protein [Formosa agariphila KMM 3901]|uniref:GPR1/FUN34/yaaH family protein n=1 Tax=Formosa agariphila (strain DSM 15362 / KCTC 12365 / LMG 23005 / KMM 3901 / M-2Alg 35-1) TaxID=1347342 RepID=T2KIC6_FORAG|nr:GPR1/FUN34/YaaH family transporter [Formosa agariphila]CDF78176.1 GPR1/FUN34/yaaH family protein [Formosa agariphila KMM 3901]